MLLYFNAGFALLFWGLGLITLGVAAAAVFAGYGIANEQRFGYILGVAVAGFLVVGALSGLVPTGIFSLMFDALLLYLLLSEESRNYQRIWFS